MKRSSCFISLAAIVLLTLASSAAAQFPPAPKPLEPKVPQGTEGCRVDSTSCAAVAPAIMKSAMGPSPLEENLHELTDVIGGRISGSPAADKAVEWAVGAFRQAGVDEVLTENFTLPVGWTPGRAQIEMLAPEPFPVRAVSIGWSPATPEGGVTSNIVDVGMGDAAGFARVGAAAKGAILLIHTNVLKTWDDLMAEYSNEPAMITRAVNAGAAAILWMSTRPYLLLYRHNLSLTGGLEKLPQAVVAREDALRIARFIAAGKEVRAKLELPNRIAGETASENVVAEIRGREKPEEFIVVGAHLDSWDLGTGALDDGCNAAMLIDAARAIHASGARPRRSIRFVLFTGEEQGMLGSWAYALAHRRELDHMDAAIIFDSGDGKITGYSLGGRHDISNQVAQALLPLARFGPFDNTFDSEIGTDNLDFLLEGVPTLVANQEPDDYMMNYHAASDTFDKLDFTQLKRNEAIAVVTAYGVADLPEPLGPRLTRKQIEALNKKSGLEKEMKETGLWPLWESGKRGRN